MFDTSFEKHRLRFLNGLLRAFQRLDLNPGLSPQKDPTHVGITVGHTCPLSPSLQPASSGSMSPEPSDHHRHQLALADRPTALAAHRGIRPVAKRALQILLVVEGYARGIGKTHPGIAVCQVAVF
ncbi:MULTISPECIES: hypothetical protein [unclassified Devosia]|uniref:hypothetical protein n=1 Tax=unclassified Devosia TaxID=196773 RepID=UPI001AC7EE57|nr:MULTISPECIES: hypothetical protein [unclassified Devosia]MBN9306770.1 hypothetical protein [Devosia sp.]